MLLAKLGTNYNLFLRILIRRKHLNFSVAREIRKMGFLILKPLIKG